LINNHYQQKMMKILEVLIIEHNKSQYKTMNSIIHNKINAKISHTIHKKILPKMKQIFQIII